MRKLIYIINLDIKKTVFSIVFLIYSISAYSQGTWDINYISIKALNASFIGKEIRIDFKASNNDTLSGEIKTLGIRRLLSKKDSVSLNVNNKSVEFIEHWKLHVDHGVLADQYLESVTNEVKEKIFIKEMFLESINDDSLIVQAMVCMSNSKSEVKERIVISKSVIKGLLVSKAN
ncbi:hypothetical protein ACFS6H_04895 [Terrimonas rubra]|uniref:Uncharacterized protein n=1 Tax=Terrimonas rubra TaxID=1035890 RepID=A0ABW6A191_9BACT